MLHDRLVALSLAVTLAATHCPSPTVRASAVPVAPLPAEGSAPSAASADGLLTLRHFGGAAPFTYYSGIDDSTRLVVRDAASWRARWDAINRAMKPPPPLPQVDFAREMVVVAALGRRASGGWSIVIDSAAWRGRVVDVFVRQLAPGRGCFTSAAISAPVDVALLPRRDAPVRFTERLVREDCD